MKLTFGTKIEIIVNYTQINNLFGELFLLNLLIAGLCVLNINSLNVSKLLIAIYSVLLYRLVTIIGRTLTELYCNIVNYEDILLKNRFFQIIYKYNYTEQVELIPFWYKKLTGISRLFTDEEIHNILNSTTTADDIKKNIFQFIIDENQLITNINALNTLDSMPIIFGTSIMTIFLLLMYCLSDYNND